MITVVIGAQWGDEGKGKFVDILARNYDIVARYNGGSNAGHTVCFNGKKIAVNQLPSGFAREECMNLIGNGVVVNIPKLLDEIKSVEDAGINIRDRLYLSDRAHLVFGFHLEIDQLCETKKGSKGLGTTRRGIGPCYSSKMSRNGVRVGELKYIDRFENRLRDLYEDLRNQYNLKYDIEKEIELYREYALEISPMIVDGIAWINKQIQKKKRILLEGANAIMLDIDFGTYPFVTSSSPGVGGACIGVGITPKKITNVIGIVKAYTTRVGSGPFPTELESELDEKLRESGKEYGTTTGRSRRCGWLDLVQVNYAHQLNGFDSICLTKLDCLNILDEIKIGVKYNLRGKEIDYMPSNLDDLSVVSVVYETLPGFKDENLSKCRTWEELPENARKYVSRIEEILKIPIDWIGVGPDREDIIKRERK